MRRGHPPTVKARNAWLAEHGAFGGEFVELGGEKVSLEAQKNETGEQLASGHARSRSWPD
jgi:hypothetical protein